MKTLLCLYLSISLAILTIPAVAFADEPECKEAISLTTPCTGVLLPPGAAANGLRCLKLDLPKLKLDLELHTKLAIQKQEHLNALLAIERNRNEQLVGQVDHLLQIDRTPEWYSSPYLWMGVGLVVGAGISIGIAHSLPR